jgi:nucleoid-associated protein YgaU
MTDATGAFVLIPKRLPPGNYDLALRVTEPDGRIVKSKTSVAVKLSTAKADKPVVASAAPETAAVVPPKPNEEKPAPSKERFADIRIDSVEAKGGGELHVSGIAAPGSNVRLFLNDAYIASGTASPDGQVQFSIRSGVKAGDYRLRLERLSPSGSVLSRAEAPFQAPAAGSREVVSAQGSLPSGVASAAGQVASESRSVDVMPRAVTGSTTTRANAIVVPNIDTKVVVRGDNLWRMSQESYGNGERYTLIYGANRSKIRDPDLIYPGQIFVLPQTPPR